MDRSRPWINRVTFNHLPEAYVSATPHPTDFSVFSWSMSFAHRDTTVYFLTITCLRNIAVRRTFSPATHRIHSGGSRRIGQITQSALCDAYGKGRPDYAPVYSDYMKYRRFGNSRSADDSSPHPDPLVADPPAQWKKHTSPTPSR